MIWRIDGERRRNTFLLAAIAGPAVAFFSSSAAAKCYTLTSEGRDLLTIVADDEDKETYTRVGYVETKCPGALNLGDNNIDAKCARLLAMPQYAKQAFRDLFRITPQQICQSARKHPKFIRE